MDSHSCCTCPKGWLQHPCGQQPVAATRIQSCAACCLVWLLHAAAVRQQTGPGTAALHHPPCLSLLSLLLAAEGPPAKALEALAVSTEHQLGPQANEQCSARSLAQEMCALSDGVASSVQPGRLD